MLVVIATLPVRFGAGAGSAAACALAISGRAARDAASRFLSFGCFMFDERERRRERTVASIKRA